MSLIIKQEPHYSDYFMLAAKYALMHEKDTGEDKIYYDYESYEDKKAHKNYTVCRYGIGDEKPYELGLEDWDDDAYVKFLYDTYWKFGRFDKIGYPLGFILFDCSVILRQRRRPVEEITYLMNEYKEYGTNPYALSNKVINKIHKMGENELKKKIFIFHNNLFLKYMESDNGDWNKRNWFPRTLYLSDIKNQKLDTLKAMYPEIYSEGEVK